MGQHQKAHDLHRDDADETIEAILRTSIQAREIYETEIVIKCRGSANGRAR